MAKRSRACNVCGEAASKICSQCRCRHYCGQKCQRQDWRNHKQYCSKPKRGKKSDQIEDLKKMWLQEKAFAGPSDEDDLQNTWNEFLQKAGGSDANLDDVNLEILEKNVVDAIKESFPAELTDRDIVGYPMDVVKQLGLLPSLPLRHDEFVLSYSTFGQMDSVTGQLLYCICCMSNMTEMARAVGTCEGVPSVHDCESVLFTAMIKPMPGAGEPMRPAQVLLAHRCGAKMYEILSPFLTEHGIFVRLETEAEAKHSAAMNNVDPNGFNV
eukprot:Skav233630  [mRNA]  locus=scaffold492:79556:80362:- [translate_table: standard]